MPKQLWPKERKKKDKSGYRYTVMYDLAYDFQAGEWVGHYRTKIGAHLAAFWNVHIASWGGRAILFDTKESKNE